MQELRYWLDQGPVRLHREGYEEAVAIGLHSGIDRLLLPVQI
jgi:hypothetical protein